MRLLVAALVCVAAPVRGGTLPPHPIPESERWATVTHPGNAPFEYQPTMGPVRAIGRVDYEYQIMRTEVTVAEWYEFVVAYSPYVNPQQAGSFEFTGSGLLEGVVDFDHDGPIRMGWQGSRGPIRAT